MARHDQHPDGSPPLLSIHSLPCLQLCNRGMVEKVPLWFTPANPGTPLHAEIPVQTAVVMPTFSFETQTEFYVLFFAFDKLEVRREGGERRIWQKSLPLLTATSITTSSAPAAAATTTILLPKILPPHKSGYLCDLFLQSSSAKLAYLRFLAKAAGMYMNGWISTGGSPIVPIRICGRGHHV